MRKVKRVCGVLLAAAVVITSMYSANLRTIAADTITIAPENVLNVQVVDKDGNAVDNVNMTMKDATNQTVARWTSGSTSVTGYNNSGIKGGSTFLEPMRTFAEIVAPYELKKLYNLNNGSTTSYNENASMYFNESETRNYQLLYIGESETALKVPANTVKTVVDEDWASRHYTYRFKLANGIYYTFNDLVGVTSHTVAAGDYDNTELWCGGVGNTASSMTVSSEETEYIKVRLRLCEISDYFNEDGTYTDEDDNIDISFATDSAEQGAMVAFISGSVINAPIPDAQGYVEIYVEKSTRKISFCTIFNGSYRIAGGYHGIAYEYDKKDITVQTIDFPDEGTNLLNVPAGNYTIELSNVPSKYEAETTAVTVVDSQNVQTLKIVLADVHVHDYSEEYEKDEDGHWKECACGNKTEEAAHTPGPAATETSAQTCIVCGYEIAPAIEHVHDYSEEYEKDEDGHWKECACGDKTDEATHGFTWVTDKEATATEAGSKHEECTTCGYKKAAVTIPATGTPEPEPQPEPQPEPAPQPQPTAPKTADNTSNMLWMWVLLAGVIVLAGNMLAGQKKRNR